MPRISFCFQGWVRDTEIEEATNVESLETIDVSTWTDERLIAAIQSGEVAISFADAYIEGNKCNVELHDFDSAE